MALISKIYNSSTFRQELWRRKHVDQSKPIMRWSGTRYEVHRSYPIKDTLKRSGFRYDPERKCWFTEDVKTAVKFIKLADDPTKDQLIFLMT